MKELSTAELKQVSGGAVPLIAIGIWALRGYRVYKAARNTYVAYRFTKGFAKG